MVFYNTLSLMSGHSKWSTIKRQKGMADVKRGQTFTKVSNTITMVVKMSGDGDPESNPRLRMIMEEAKTVNMPRENIQRAIDKGLGKLPGQSLESVLYEGFGPCKAAFIVSGVTDNKLRTLQEIKNIFERGGGNLGGQGSVAYMFDRIGEIKVRSKGGNKDIEILELIDLGAGDIEDNLEADPPTGGQAKQTFLVYVQSSELNTMGNKITQAGFLLEGAEIIYKPNVIIEINDIESARKVLEFADKLEGNEDVHKVYTNFDIPDEIITKL